MSVDNDTSKAEEKIVKQNGMVSIKLRQIVQAKQENHTRKTDLIIEAGAMSVTVRLSEQDCEKLANLIEPA